MSYFRAISQIETRLRNNQRSIPLPLERLNNFLGGIGEEEQYLLFGATGSSKCLGKGTRVLLFDGSLKAVEEVQIGDQLMGPDSSPRRVLAIGRGREQMYWVHQKNGNSYRVNESHILSLKDTRSGKVVNISVRDYLKKSNDFKRLHKGYKVGVDFEERLLSIDPYFLGIWLGDGRKATVAVTNEDPEVIEYMADYAHRLNLQFNQWDHNTFAINRGPCRSCSNPLLEAFQRYNLLFNKHIPDDFLVNTRENRLLLLAGLLDTDGCYIEKQKGFSITQVNEHLANQITFLSRSLGFRASLRSRIATMKRADGSVYSTPAYSVSITGDLTVIPTRVARRKATAPTPNKDNLRCGIEVVPDIVDEYYGFTVDQDELFLLDDFTVTHNTKLTIQLFVLSLINFVRANPDLDVKVIYNTLELSVEEIWMNIFCHLLHQKTGKVYSIPFLKNKDQKNPLTPEILLNLEKIKPELDLLSNHLVILDHLRTPLAYYEFLKKFLMSRGDMVFDTINEGSYYKKKNPNELVVVITDTINAFEKDKDLDKYGSLKRWSANFCKQNLKMVFKCCVVNIQQMDKEATRITYNFKNERNEDKAVPRLEYLSECKTTPDDATCVLSIYNPSRYEVAQYAGYDVLPLGNHFRYLNVLKNSHGDENVGVALYVDNLHLTAQEIPPVDNQELVQRFYLDKTGVGMSRSSLIPGLFSAQGITL